MSNQEKTQGNVKQMKVSTTLSRILSESLLVAKDFHHEFFTPEHVLATAIRDEFVEQLLQNSGGDTKELKTEVSNYLTTKLPMSSKFVDIASFSISYKVRLTIYMIPSHSRVSDIKRDGSFLKFPTI